VRNQKRRSLLGNGSKNIFPWQRICKRNNRGSVGSDVFCRVSPEAVYRELKPIVGEYGVYTEALHDLTAALKESAAKGERPKTSITARPSYEEFREHGRRELELSDDTDKRTKEPATFVTGVSDP
jgi:hypothetical protein